MGEPFQEGLTRAFWYFLNSWVTRNGTAGTREYNQNFCRRFTSNGGGPATRLSNAICSIPAWRRRMRGVSILKMDAFSMLGRIEDKRGAVIYCDPPYFEKGADYVHDFARADHIRLAKLLHRFKETRVVLSYYQHPMLDELYPGWTKRQVYLNKAMNNSRMRDQAAKAVVAPEVLLINGPSYATEAA
jgi:DNA adenine methylase